MFHLVVSSCNHQPIRLISVELNVVFAKEISASAKKSKIDWMLLTDLPVSKKKDALQIIDFYKMRWSIENYHKVIKSDCTIEKCRLNTADRCIIVMCRGWTRFIEIVDDYLLFSKRKRCG